jgi:hypothetical protein
MKSMSIETEAVERYSAAINRNDMQTVTDEIDPEHAAALKWAGIEA